VEGLGEIICSVEILKNENYYRGKKEKTHPKQEINKPGKEDTHPIDRDLKGDEN